MELSVIDFALYAIGLFRENLITKNPYIGITNFLDIPQILVGKPHFAVKSFCLNVMNLISIRKVIKFLCITLS